jgi:hypothetical protein
MNLYQADRRWRTGELYVAECDAADAIKESLHYGSESNQLATLQDLVALLAAKLLESGVITRQDLLDTDALVSNYVLDPKDVSLEED